MYLQNMVWHPNMERIDPHCCPNLQMWCHYVDRTGWCRRSNPFKCNSDSFQNLFLVLSTGASDYRIQKIYTHALISSANKPRPDGLNRTSVVRVTNIELLQNNAVLFIHKRLYILFAVTCSWGGTTASCGDRWYSEVEDARSDPRFERRVYGSAGTNATPPSGR